MDNSIPEAPRYLPNINKKDKEESKPVKTSKVRNNPSKMGIKMRVASTVAGLVTITSTLAGGIKAEEKLNIIPNPAPAKTYAADEDFGSYVAPESPLTAQEKIKKDSIGLFFKNLTPEEAKEVNQKVDARIEFYEHYNKPADYARVFQYDKLIDDYAKKYGVNRDVAQSLMFIESRGIHDDESHAGAVGLWQLMPKTAQDMGLEVDLEKGIDERTNIVDSTDAAMRYIVKLKENFGDIFPIAYNWGWGNTNNALEDAGLEAHKTNAYQLSEKTSSMPLEAKNYTYNLAAVNYLIHMYKIENGLQ